MKNFGKTKTFSLSSTEYQGERGTTYCLQCDSGTYQPQTGQKSCLNCQKGKFEDVKRSIGPCRWCPTDLVGNFDVAATQCIAEVLDKDVPTPEIIEIKPGASSSVAALMFSMPMRKWRREDTIEVQVSFEMDFDTIEVQQQYTELGFDFLTQESTDKWAVGLTIDVSNSLYRKKQRSSNHNTFDHTGRPVQTIGKN